MKMWTIWAAALVTGVVVAPPARGQVVVGNFTYQFADAVTGVAIPTLSIPQVGQTAKVALYLVQTGGTPTITTLGLEGVGVRLNYASPAGVLRVPSTASANIAANPVYDFVQRGGPTAANTDTSQTAYISEGLLANDLPFPPANDALRMLIGVFTLTGLANGTETITAVDPFPGAAGGNQNLTGPNPPGGIPDGQHGEIAIDPLLAQNAVPPNVPSLLVQVGPVPEPGTMALVGLAATSLGVWRRRRTASTAA